MRQFVTLSHVAPNTLGKNVVGQHAPVLALSGGIGGAKLALGLYRVLDPDELFVVCNTGDDFEHLGLHVSPDVDTVMYTLAGIANPRAGWGRADETWAFMHALAELGGETWFRLGDRDLATNVERTRRLRDGASLTEVTADFCRRLGVHATLWPMSDDPVRTRVHTTDGVLPFQDYFVRRACEPRVTGFDFVGADCAAPNPELLALLADCRPRAIVVCPSNPYISVDPMLAVPGLAAALRACAAPIVAVSPIVAGDAIKGPTAKMMHELGVPTTTTAIAAHYAGLLDGIVIDESDAAQADDLAMPCHVTRVLMRTTEDKEALARDALAFSDRLAERAGR